MLRSGFLFPNKSRMRVLFCSIFMAS
jgi:hypothetical protein